MNDLEFSEQYKRLQVVHPNYFGTQEKMATIWHFVGDMDVRWFKSLVDRIIMANRADKIDIGEAVANERRNRKSVAFAEAVSAATKTWANMTEKGLENVLEKYKATNLLEAVRKSQKGEV